MSRPEVVKAIWQYIKHHSLQDPKDKRFILCDELLRPVMGGKQRVNAFGMNRYIGEHLYRPEDVVSRPVTVHAASHESNQRIQKSSVAAKEAKGKKIGSGGGFMKPLLLSPALSEVLGGEKEVFIDYDKTHHILHLIRKYDTRWLDPWWSRNYGSI
jgi:chromatin remodeling complex protein RSC6